MRPGALTASPRSPYAPRYTRQQIVTCFRFLTVNCENLGTISAADETIRSTFEAIRVE